MNVLRSSLAFTRFHVGLLHKPVIAWCLWICAQNDDEAVKRSFPVSDPVKWILCQRWSLWHQWSRKVRRLKSKGATLQPKVVVTYGRGQGRSSRHEGPTAGYGSWDRAASAFRTSWGPEANRCLCLASKWLLVATVLTKIFQTAFQKVVVTVTTSWNAGMSPWSHTTLRLCSKVG